MLPMSVLRKRIWSLFLVVLSLESVACQSPPKAGTSRLGPLSAELSGCGEIFKKRISNALSKDFSPREFASLGEEEKRRAIAAKVYSLLPEQERAAIYAAYREGALSDKGGRILIGNLQDTFQKIDLCSASRPELDAYIFQDQLSGFLYERGFDIESIFPVAYSDKPELGDLSSVDILLVYVIRAAAK
jgi:hypothetical protein